MDNRKKLIELIQAAVDGCATYWAGLIADHLIANGVTVQRWIPVEEEKPKEFISVLGHMTDAEIFPAVRECYLVDGAFFFPALHEFRPVDKWSYMPEPPKEEE